jgi:hypothetical protein
VKSEEIQSKQTQVLETDPVQNWLIRDGISNLGTADRTEGRVRGMIPSDVCLALCGW